MAANRSDLSGIPDEVIEWIRSVFAECNSRVSEKLSMAPNVQEALLDLTWVEQLSRHAYPVAFGSDWSVRIDSHFLGGCATSVPGR